MSNWLLPESLADILPTEARRIEELRRYLLDLYRTYGFELVAPPLVEYLESLQAVSGTKLNLRTNKLVDQLSGRTMGVRADITPQAARIDAHLLNREGVTRLCYCGTVLHARPAGLLSDRELLQIGAEIFGYAGVEADIEIIQLALASVARAGVQQARLDLNLPAIGHALINHDSALVPFASEIFDLLSAKDAPGIHELKSLAPGCRADSIQYLLTLTNLYGNGSETIAIARERLPGLPEITSALDGLESLIAALSAENLTIDLADMGGSYGYHSGVVFSVYAPGWHDALVRGGRYDGVGAMYGRSRPATGFSLDLRKLSGGLPPAEAARAIRAPWGKDASLIAMLEQLREAGEIVIQMLPDQPHALDEFIIDRELVLHDGLWQVRAISA
ncbi:ATP phosphoribosyltransferase regulatory subunit [Paenalcaligenes niemegkensis]|uniref:ATP phosphoribosyltransferase regulatory subunit n=1 Tax=Paenalcaligenes niemegkensis TaxID=2895469 RepID=UPI001EE78D96|nr:ATP phosphoribosyltransferase regulatory subunit [Paenalcaligenes niemegkensis]MCQ9616722.1 ATP phosphoribosyltransferase regulatory subunit [Paenalcaligenes niemegkensis]